MNTGINVLEIMSPVKIAGLVSNKKNAGDLKLKRGPVDQRKRRQLQNLLELIAPKMKIFLKPKLQNRYFRIVT